MEPESPLLLERVDLHDDAVDLVLDVVAVLAGVDDEPLHLVGAIEQPVVRGGGQAPRLEPCVGLALAGDLEALPGADAVHDEVQRPGGGDGGVLLPERAGGGVAGVRERRLAGLDQRRVEVGEFLGGEEDLPADLDQPGQVVARQPVWDAGDRQHVAGDVFAHPAVATGGCGDEASVAVGEVDREPVDLELAQPADRLAVDAPLGPAHPLAQLVGREDVVEAVHLLRVLHRREVGDVRHADPLGGGVGRAQARELLLELLQVAHELVVLGVGDGRRVAPVVGLLRLVDAGGQIGPPVTFVEAGLGRRPTGLLAQFGVLGGLVVGPVGGRACGEGVARSAVGHGAHPARAGRHIRRSARAGACVLPQVGGTPVSTASCARRRTGSALTQAFLSPGPPSPGSGDGRPPGPAADRLGACASTSVPTMLRSS